MDPFEQAISKILSYAFCRTCFLPSRIVCPDIDIERELLARLRLALAEKEHAMHVINLRPAPVARLMQLTEELPEWNDPALDEPVPQLRVVVGMDRLDSNERQGAAGSFKVRFDNSSSGLLWLFIGRDAVKLKRVFYSHSWPLYATAFDCTPEAWRTEIPGGWG